MALLGRIVARIPDADHLDVVDSARVNNNLSVGEGLHVGQGGALIEGPLSVASREDNYILGWLSLGEAGFIDESIDYQTEYPTHQLDVHGQARFRIEPEHNLFVTGAERVGAFLDLAPSFYGAAYSTTARIQFRALRYFTDTEYTTDFREFGGSC